MTGAGRRLGVAALLAVATAACGVPTSDARVAGVGPDTSPAALERAAREESAQREREELEASREDRRLLLPPEPGTTDLAVPSVEPQEGSGVPAPPAPTHAAPAEDGVGGTVPVLLRDADGPRYVTRPTAALGDPAALVAALAAPLTTEELASGLWSEVPPETYLAGIERRGSRSIVQLGGFDGGGTDAAIWRRSQQVACTLAHHDPAVSAVEVRAGGEWLGLFGQGGDEACP